MKRKLQRLKWAVIGAALSIVTCGCGASGADMTRALDATGALIRAVCNEPLPPEGPIPVTRKDCDNAVAGWNLLHDVNEVTK